MAIYCDLCCLKICFSVMRDLVVSLNLSQKVIRTAKHLGLSRYVCTLVEHCHTEKSWCLLLVDIWMFLNRFFFFFQGLDVYFDLIYYQSTQA